MKLVRAVFLAMSAVACLAAAPAPTPAAPLSPADAQQALAVVQDAAQRAKLIEVLRTIAAATPHAPEKAAEQAGLADKTIHALSNSAAELSDQVASAAAAAARAPGLWIWITTTLRDPAGRAVLLDATWRLLAVLGCGVAAEWLLWRALVHPMKWLAAHPGGPGSSRPARQPPATGRRPPAPSSRRFGVFRAGPAAARDVRPRG